MAIVATVGFAIAAVALRVADGAAASLGGLIAQCVRSVAWIGGGTVALAAAHDRGGLDRAEGIDVLAALGGAPAPALRAARAAGAIWTVALTIGAPGAALAVLTAVLAPSPEVALRRLGLALGALAFAVASGTVLGLLASAAGHLAGRRGRWLLVGLVVVPWALADVAGRPTWSVPGALDALLTLAFRVAGGRSA